MYLTSSSVIRLLLFWEYYLDDLSIYLEAALWESLRSTNSIRFFILLILTELSLKWSYWSLCFTFKENSPLICRLFLYLNGASCSWKTREDSTTSSSVSCSKVSGFILNEISPLALDNLSQFWSSRGWTGLNLLGIWDLDF